MSNKTVTEHDLKILKDMYKDPLFKWIPPSKNFEIIFKPLNHENMKHIVNMIYEAEKYNKPVPYTDINQRIFDSCVVFPEFTIEEKESLPVGIVPSVAKVIQEKSGFVDIDVFGRDFGPDMLSTMIRDFDYWGDVTEADLKALKKDCVFQLFRVRIDRWVFIVRPMTRTDLQVASQSQDDSLALSRAVTMWPREIDWDTIPAGIVDILVKEVNKISGWNINASCEEI